MTKVALPLTLFGHISLKMRKSILANPPNPNPTAVLKAIRSQYEFDSIEPIPNKAAIVADKIKGALLPLRSDKYPKTTAPALDDIQVAKFRNAKSMLDIPNEASSDGSM